MSGKDQTGNYVTAVSLNAASAETCVVMDGYDNWRSNKSNHMTVSKLLTAPEDVRIAKHNLEANVSFYDGSAKPIQVGAAQGASPPGSTSWGHPPEMDPTWRVGSTPHSGILFWNLQS